MRYKFIIIGLLLLLLAFTVYQMLQYEQSIREERIVREYVYDESGPLIEPMEVEVLHQKAQQADYYFREDGNYFKRLNTLSPGEERDWDPVFFKGVNLGVALPGYFPGEFPMTFENYMDWLRKIGQMHSNVVRLYTILPPEFYAAFARYNLLHHDRPLYLIQGVWATVPKDKNYFNERYTRSLKKEIIDVIDVLHGQAVISPERGRASGAYTYDVSRYVAGIIFGREWEPDAVHHTIKTNDRTRYRGDFISVHKGHAMEAWLAEMLDFIARYETQYYGMQHPLSFVNWLPLDPMYHNTEIIENDRVREYDNDLECLHFDRLHHNQYFIPGLFASYHAYPYYPDFIYLDSTYRNPFPAKESDHFKSYLEHLKRHHRGMPLLISEYGVPSSRGNSHVTPTGYDQGGHSEAAQARINVKLSEDIVESGCAGAIIFEWADEWFKHNWLVMDFERPEHHRPRWHNLENPEQNFGLLALEGRTKTIDGQLSDWDKHDFKDGDITYASAGDPGYFYLAMKLDGFNFDEEDLYLAFDVIGKEQGDHRLPFSDQTFQRGFEFLLEFINRDSARILVDEPYSVFTDIYNDSIPDYASKRNANGKYVEQQLLANRKRESLLGQTFDSIMVNRSHLIHGNSSLPESSNADWYWNDSSKVLELRLTWHLINVTDPSGRYVLDNRPETNEMEYTEVDGFTGLVFTRDSKSGTIERFPKQGYLSMSWEPWERPEYTSRLKPTYDSMKNYFANLTIPEDKLNIDWPEKEVFEIAAFYDDKKGALSLSFDQGLYSQFTTALPVLDKYLKPATIGIVPEFLDESPGQYESDEMGRTKRISLRETRLLSERGHEFALQNWLDSPDPARALSELESLLEERIEVQHKSSLKYDPRDDSLFLFTRYFDPSKNEQLTFAQVSYRVYSARRISMVQWFEILHDQSVPWTIPVYKHLYFEGAEEATNRRDGEFGLSQDRFDRQIRLARNEGYWIARESDVFKYLKEKQSSTLRINTYGNTIFVKAINDLNDTIYDHPLTILYRTSAPFVELSGSATDGIYTNRSGVISFDLLPGREVTINKIQ